MAQPPVPQPIPATHPIPATFPRPYEQVSQTALIALHPPVRRAPIPDAASAVRLPESAPAAPVEMPREDFFDPSRNQADKAAVPKTQPILVKKKAGAPSDSGLGNAEDMPRLDVTLAESRGHAMHREALPRREPTVVQLPGVGDQDDGRFAISSPDSPMERPPYRAPVPVALTPPGGEYPQPAYQEQTEYFDHATHADGLAFPLDDPGQSADPEHVFELDPYSSGLETTSDGSIAALLEQQNDSRAASYPKSKDEILDELLGVVPPRRKKGLSASSIVMLVITGLVLAVASLGTIYVIQKAGGTSVTSAEVHGEEGISNLNKKPDPGKADSKSGETSVQEPSPTPEKTESIDPAPIASVENTAKAATVEPKAPEPPPVSPAPAPDAGPPDPAPASASVPTPAPNPVVAKKNYNPRPYYDAPKPGDPPLMNMHDLIDAFMRAPNCQARIPYIYHGESLRPSVIDYYKRWPDFSLDDFRIRWHSSEEAPETGGPFWVFLITKPGQSEEDLEMPLIIRSENGHLKVDWETFAEFWDQHFVHFFKNGAAFNPPHHFRLVIERLSEYPGPDKPGFTDLKDYLCYSLNPPYGGFQAYQEYAFVKAGTPLAKQIDERAGLGETGLAVIVKVDKKDFSHGVRHWMISELTQEGWLK